jgi:hypothetical protein
MSADFGNGIQIAVWADLFVCMFMTFLLESHLVRACRAYILNVQVLVCVHPSRAVRRWANHHQGMLDCPDHRSLSRHQHVILMLQWRYWSVRSQYEDIAVEGIWEIDRVDMDDSRLILMTRSLTSL